MKIILSIILIILCIIVLFLAGLSLVSRKAHPLGISNGQLTPCQQTPNCVCSEYNNGPAYISPLEYSIAHADAWHSIKQSVKNTGGEVLAEESHYIHATYVTPLLRFTDDLELRLDEDHHLIHVRSTSRVGHSDLGTNRRRVEMLRKHFKSN